MVQKYSSYNVSSQGNLAARIVSFNYSRTIESIWEDAAFKNYTHMTKHVKQLSF